MGLGASTLPHRHKTVRVSSAGQRPVERNVRCPSSVRVHKEPHRRGPGNPRVLKRVSPVGYILINYTSLAQNVRAYANLRSETICENISSPWNAEQLPGSVQT